MNLLEYGDGVGLVKTPSGVGTMGDHARQVDNGSTANPAPSWIDDVETIRTMWWSQDYANGSTTVSPPFATSTTGAGASAHALVSDVYPNAFVYSTGTTTTGRAGRTYAAALDFDTTGHVWRYDAIFMIPTLSVTAQQFNLTLGFADTPTTIDSVDGAYMKVDSQTNAVAQFITTANSVQTATSSGVTIVAGTWYRLVIGVTNVTNVQFYLYAVGSAFPNPTIVTTNIPTGTTRATAVQAVALKSLGTTPRTVNVAYQQFSHDRLAA